MKLFEWENKSFVEFSEKVPEFISYLSIAWENRKKWIDSSEVEDEEEIQVSKIQKQRFFDFTIDGNISARNYVGVVQFDGIRIEVYPKIFSESPIKEYSKWQINFLYWLSYCKKIKFPFSFANVSKLDFEDYLELLIYVFANYTEQIISQQPFQAYQTITEETSFLKGKLSFDNYVKHNLSTGKWQNFYCSHEPFVFDNLFNRIVKYVTRRLHSITENYITKERLGSILFILDDVSDVKCTLEDCEKVKLNPLYAELKDVLELCRLFLANQVIDMENESSSNFCFLLPMEYIFEDFVFGFLSDKWPELGLRSQSTDFLATVDGNKVFQIRNDMYIQSLLVIDTKYKRRSTEDTRKAGVGQADMYQMISYALKRHTKNVLLLYPYFFSGCNEPKTFKVSSNLLPYSLDILVKNIDITFDNIKEADVILENRFEKLHDIFLK